MGKIGSAVLIAVLLVISALTLTDDVGWQDTGQTAGIRIAITSVALLLLIAFVLFAPAVRSPTKTALGKPKPARTSKNEIFEVYHEVTHSYSKETLSLLVRMLIELPTYIVRISEEAKVEEAPLIFISTRQYYEIDKASKRFSEFASEVPADPADARVDTESTTAPPGRTVKKPTLMLVPLMQPEKGVLIDSFSVTDANGCELPTLSHNRVRALIVYTLEALLKIAIEAGRKEMEKTPEDVRRESLPAFAKIVAAVCSAGPSRKKFAGNQQMIDEALKAIALLPLKQEWRDRLRRFCLQYIDCYVIVAEVLPPAGDHLMLTYSYRVPCEGATSQSVNRWRSRFGLTPATFDLPVNVHAFQVDAYHLQMTAEGGQYVYDHHLERLNTQEVITQDDLRRRDFKPYVRLYHDEGRPNAHLYIRRQGEAPPPPGLTRLKSVIQFREIPPGVLGAATVVAAASTALITFFALTHLGLGIDVKSANQQDQITATLNSDIPALLLALPAFTAALIGSWTDLSRVRRASVITYMSLAATMILSLGSAFHFVYDANHKLPTEFTARLLGDVQIRTEAIWLGLMGLSWTLVLFMARQWISESRHYFRAVERRVARQLH